MRTTIAIFLLVLVVSVQTPVGQLFKLPLLVEHFIKHQKQNHNSLIGFLEDHYTNGHNDSDLPEDENLPFKNIMYYAAFAIVPGVIKNYVFFPLPAGKKIFFTDTYVLQQHLACIFHPPRK